MIKRLGPFIIALLLTSCASSLLPSDQRRLEIIKKTTFSKNINYKNSLIYFTRAFKDINKVIKFKDEEAGQIILKGNTSCNIFRQSGDINEYSLQFTLNLNVKNKKVRFIFEDLFISNSQGKAVGWSYNQLSSNEKTRESKKCLSTLVNGSISKPDNNSDW